MQSDNNDIDMGGDQLPANSPFYLNQGNGNANFNIGNFSNLRSSSPSLSSTNTPILNRSPNFSPAHSPMLTPSSPAINPSSPALNPSVLDSEFDKLGLGLPHMTPNHIASPFQPTHPLMQPNQAPFQSDQFPLLTTASQLSQFLPERKRAPLPLNPSSSYLLPRSNNPVNIHKTLPKALHRNPGISGKSRRRQRLSNTLDANFVYAEAKALYGQSIQNLPPQEGVKSNVWSASQPPTKQAKHSADDSSVGTRKKHIRKSSHRTLPLDWAQQAQNQPSNQNHNQPPHNPPRDRAKTEGDLKSVRSENILNAHFKNANSLKYHVFHASSEKLVVSNKPMELVVTVHSYVYI